VITKDIFRCLPRITSSSHIEWIEWICLAGFDQFVNSIGATNANVAELLAILLRLLGQMPAVSQRSVIDKQVISALQAFAAWTILSPANLYRIRVEIWTPLNTYHPNANIDFDSLLQMGIMEIIAPKSDGQPINLIEGFDWQKYSDIEWCLPDAEIQASKHPFQHFIKKKHQYLLIGSIRGHEGAKEFKRTNLGLLKRCSTIQVGEALKRGGIMQLADMLILHRSLKDAITNKQFSSSQPQEADYLRLHKSYQQDLAAKKESPCSLIETNKRLEELGCCVRNYGNSRMVSLNEFAGDNNNCEFIHRLSADNYADTFDELIDRERQQQAIQLKTKVYHQLDYLPRVQLEALCLNALGYNDRQVAVYQQVSASTIKRRRGRIICQIIDVAVRSKQFKAIDAAYLQVVEDYFIPEITTISRAQFHRSRDMLEATELVILAINSKWNLSLCANARLQKALQQMFQQEGVA
jgi:hypothetical protein